MDFLCLFSRAPPPRSGLRAVRGCSRRRRSEEELEEVELWGSRNYPTAKDSSGTEMADASAVALAMPEESVGCTGSRRVTRCG